MKKIYDSQLYADNKPEERRTSGWIAGCVVLTIALLAANLFIPTPPSTRAVVATLLGGIVASGVAIYCNHMARRRRSPAGAKLSRYLEGLRYYIKVAEAERLKLLQSPQAVEKVGKIDAATSQSARLKLYEKVLPYAVLFGQEKQWLKELGNLYQATNTKPGWVSGGNFMQMAMFASLASDLSSSITHASTYSSSSGGSSGGGYVGGGGGGGGGGGW